MNCSNEKLNELNIGILEILKAEKLNRHIKYIQAVATAAGTEASHNAYESHRDPDDGVGGFMTRNPYNIERSQKDLEYNKARYEHMLEMYDQAVRVFIISK